MSLYHFKGEGPGKKSLRIEDKVNSHSILSKLCFPEVHNKIPTNRILSPPTKPSS